MSNRQPSAELGCKRHLLAALSVVTCWISLCLYVMTPLKTQNHFAEMIFYIYFMSFISLISSQSGIYLMYNENFNTVVISNHLKENLFLQGQSGPADGSVSPKVRLVHS